MYIDSHVHLTDEKFTDTDEIVKNYLEAGIEFVINAGYDYLRVSAERLSAKNMTVYILRLEYTRAIR